MTTRSRQSRQSRQLPRRSVLSLCLSTIISLQSIKSVTNSSNPAICAFHHGSHWRLLFPRGTRGHRSKHPSRTPYYGETKYPSPAPRTKLFSNKESTNIFLHIFQSFQQSFQSPLSTTTPSNNHPPPSSTGQVVRTAARPYQSPTGGSSPSIPSSRYYTTRKPSLPFISLSNDGVSGDYNHYRTVALKSTPNRAISIVTRDVSRYIESIDGGYFSSGNRANTGSGGSGGVEYRDGDLGENVLIEGVDFSFFRVGQRYRFHIPKEEEDGMGSGMGGDGRNSEGNSLDAPGSQEVIIEITEPMEPCANLCKLPYINDPSLSSPRERVARCQYFIEALGQKEGLRGWYAKVIEGGVIRVGDSISALGGAVA